VIRVISAVYFLVAMFFWFIWSNWGAAAHHGAAFNLGRAIVWPAVLFPSVGAFIGGIVMLGVVAFLVFFVRLR